MIESYGAGSAVAMQQWCSASPEVVHHVLWSPRQGSDWPDGPHGFASVTRLPHGHLARVRAVAAAVERSGADVLHLHSTLAGVYGRLARLASRGSLVPVVYSPHCYAFERQDLPPSMRRLARQAEAVLSRTTDVVVAVSPHEVNLSLALNPRSTVILVPNTVLVATGLTEAESSTVRVVGVGRLCAQKDPLLFAKVARLAAARGFDLDFRWLGDGDEALRGELADANVTVSGWLPRQGVLDELRNAHVLLHTAAWEAAPLSLLEAVAVGLAPVVRDIPAMRSLGMRALFTSPMEAVDHLARLTDATERRRVASTAADAIAIWTPEVQRSRLLEAYELARSGG